MGGTVEDAVSFVLQNFSEMTRLWVRMQSSTIVRNRKRRERERQELCVLVGSNLDRLSRLDGLTLPMYLSVSQLSVTHGVPVDCFTALGAVGK